MIKAPIFGVIERRDKVADIFNNVLSQYGLVYSFDKFEINIRDKFITENTNPMLTLSAAILKKMFPRASPPCAALRALVNSGYIQ
jgi:hypothetical protein